MKAKNELLLVRAGTVAVGNEEGRELEEEEEEEEEIEEIVVVERKPATAESSGNLLKKGKGLKEQGIKARKLPKAIKENPPSKGKNISSKEKKEGKKTKTKLRQ